MVQQASDKDDRSRVKIVRPWNAISIIGENDTFYTRAYSVTICILLVGRKRKVLPRLGIAFVARIFSDRPRKLHSLVFPPRATRYLSSFRLVRVRRGTSAFSDVSRVRKKRFICRPQPVRNVLVRTDRTLEYFEHRINNDGLLSTDSKRC